MPSGAYAVHADGIGYVTHIDVAALHRIGENHDVRIYVAATPGRVADARTPLVRVSGPVDDGLADSVRRAFRLENHRTYEQDPRFGVITLTEIGSRALSPATNDPGTAIEVVAALQRVLTRAVTTDRDGEVRYPRVFLPPASLPDIVDDAFRPLARDGSAHVEVQIRLQKCLASLAASAPAQADVFRDAARAASTRAHRALDREDARILKEAVRETWAQV